MSTEIANAERFVGLSKASGAAAALAQMGERITASDLIRVPTPAGGGTQWVIPHPAGEQRVDEIVGLLVYYQPVGILWPAFDPQPGAMPVLRTLEPGNPAALAEQVGPIPADMAAVLERFRVDERRYRWADLPYNQWGSGKNGIGKRCKEQRMMFILREQDDFPLIVTAQPGSVRKVSKFAKFLSNAAGDLLQEQGVPYWRCVVGLRLEKRANRAGQPFAMIVPRLAGCVSVDTGEAAKRLWTDPLRQAVGAVLDQFEADGSGAGEDE